MIPEILQDHSIRNYVEHHRMQISNVSYGFSIFFRKMLINKLIRIYLRMDRLFFKDKVGRLFLSCMILKIAMWIAEWKRDDIIGISKCYLW